MCTLFLVCHRCSSLDKRSKQWEPITRGKCTVGGNKAVQGQWHRWWITVVWDENSNWFIHVIFAATIYSNVCNEDRVGSKIHVHVYHMYDR